MAITQKLELGISSNFLHTRITNSLPLESAHGLYQLELGTRGPSLDKENNKKHYHNLGKI